MKIKWKIILASSLLLIAMLVTALFIVNGNVETLVLDKHIAELENDSSKALTVLERLYDGQWSIKDDVLYKGKTAINDNNAIIDEIIEGKDIIASLVMGDTRVATNIIDVDGTPQVGTHPAQEVLDAVLERGEDYQGIADVVGRETMIHYTPIYDVDQNVIGIWVVGLYCSEVEGEISAVMLPLLEIMFLILLVGIAVTYVIGSRIAKGVKSVEKRMNSMKDGDFQFTYNAKLLKTKDEVGSMAKASQLMKDNVGSVLDQVQKEANVIQTSAAHTLESVESISGDINEITSVTEQLSAVMEETTASAEEMNAATHEVEQEIKEMKDKTVYVNNLSVEIKERAEGLKAKSKESHATASAIYEQSNAQLRESISKAQTIDEIKELTETILKITAKTNLLAINASIEATRAGEAGKGFAVVADQIRVLAENSKNAVSSISQITENVSEAVMNVVEDSKQLLDFVDNTVLKDYVMLVDTSAQYNSDADAVSDAVGEINRSSEKLYQSIQNISNGIGEVTEASIQGAERSVEIAEKASTISMKSSEVLAQNQHNQASIEELNKSMSFFKI